MSQVPNFKKVNYKVIFCRLDGRVLLTKQIAYMTKLLPTGETNPVAFREHVRGRRDNGGQGDPYRGFIGIIKIEAKSESIKHELRFES